MGFLDSLGDIVNAADDLLNTDLPSSKIADRIDPTAERIYIEDGFIRNVQPRLRNILMQQPDMTVVVKKRMFSSLAENYKLDLLEENEKLFYRASKRLFHNKCKALSIYEKLTKIEKLTKESGYLNSFLIPELISGVSELESLGIDILDGKTKIVIDTLRKVFALSEPNNITTWATTFDSGFINEIGDGFGTFEVTLASSISSTVSNVFGGGGASLTFENPYNLFTVTIDDIEKAIVDSVNGVRGKGFNRFFEFEIKNLVDRLKSELNSNRTSRGAAKIEFIVAPQNKIDNQLIAIIEAEGRPINFVYNSGLVGIGSSVEVDQSASDGKNGLNSSDLSLFKEIVTNTFLLFEIEKQIKQENFQYNTETNYVRKKMIQHYADMAIIQPMDVINIFISSKSKIDDKLSQGLELQDRGKGFLETIDTLVRNINTNFGNNTDVFFNGTQMSAEQLEKAAIAGPDFPDWLWRAYRTDFTQQSAGVAVFVGIVKDANQNYSGGKYTLTISCEDNAGYFNKSQINIKPSTDVWNSPLYDPLTPFNISFDAATGQAKTSIVAGELPELLPENLQLLHTQAAKFPLGRLRGTTVNNAKLRAKDRELGYLASRQVLSSPDGFVYRWKEGIEAITFAERAYPEFSSRSPTSPLLTKNPFAGQDVMNVLSLLITGQPYNFNNFLQAAINNLNSPTLSNETTNEATATAYIDGIINDLTKRNSVWGNFVPFKRLILSGEAERFIEGGRGDLTTQNFKLDSLLRKRAEILDKLALQTAGFARNSQIFAKDENAQLLPPGANSSAPTEFAASLNIELQNINNEISSLQKSFMNTISSLTSSSSNNIKIIGSDLSLNTSIGGYGSGTTEEERESDRVELRRKLNAIALRRLWKVKANDDVNLFIIDDQYDKNFDIQAFERAISGNLQLFSSEYLSVDGQIKNVASLLGLEIFADSQGHIQARPPLYNRIPSSVFYEMFKKRETTGIKLFPDFLESLFFNQLQGVIANIEVLEDELRVYGLALGLVQTNSADIDGPIKQFLSGSRQGISFGESSFNFITNPNTGKIKDKGFQSFIHQSRPDIVESNNTFPLKALDSADAIIQKNLVKTRLFDPVARADQLQKTEFNTFNLSKNAGKINQILDRIQATTGRPSPLIGQLGLLNTSNSTYKSGHIGAVNIASKMASLVSQRQKLLLSAANAIKNLSEGLALNIDDDKGPTAALFPSLNKKTTIPSILEHMIEQEDEDDLGPNSGQRYVIEDYQIINLSISEVPPAYTSVLVNGAFDATDEGAGGIVDGPANLNLSTQGGNAMSSAFAVDYDTWRRYGYRTGPAMNAPFFSNPETQCAPFAVFALNLARKNILQANLDIAGNEYYQVGDVVYIKSRDLLFYVEQVQQNFDYNGQFTTKLTLKYGHHPGDYIPTMLDIVGKIIYNTKGFTTQFRNTRFTNSDGDVSLGALIYDNEGDTGPGALLSGPRGQLNHKTLTNIIYSVSHSLNTTKFNKKPMLDIRVYYNSKANAPVEDGNLTLTAEEIRLWFGNPQQYSATAGQLVSFTSKIEESNLIDLAKIKISVIDLGSDDNINSPSSAAWNAVRMFLNNPSNSITNLTGSINQSMDNIMYRHIIDIWQTFDDVPTTIEDSTPGQSATSQFEQETKDKIEEAAQKYQESE